jgi:predicted SAM-dependent methyltransferase
MLWTFMKNLVARRARGTGRVTAEPMRGPLRLHVGGQIKHAGWEILDVRAGPHVDFVGPCTDLSVFADDSVAEIYASHVLEHLGYQAELRAALDEFHRVLIAGGQLRISVPDLATLCQLFIDPALDDAERFHVMRMMFGGQINAADFHRVGLDEGFLANYLRRAGFADIARVAHFGLFDDSSSLLFRGRPISLNLQACKPPL